MQEIIIVKSHTKSTDIEVIKGKIISYLGKKNIIENVANSPSICIKDNCLDAEDIKMLQDILNDEEDSLLYLIVVSDSYKLYTRQINFVELQTSDPA